MVREGVGKWRKASARKLVGRLKSVRCLTVVRLQSVGMCGCVAGVTGAALEAVVVLLLLAVADAAHAVRLARSELHPLNVHLCTQKGKKTHVFSALFKTEEVREKCLFPPNCGHIYEGACSACELNPDLGSH